MSPTFSGAIYIFMFFNAKEEPTRYKYLIYYTFSFLENSAIIAVWFLHTPSRSDTAGHLAVN